MTFLTKINSILSSVRFWEVVVASVIAYLGSIGTITPEVATLIAGILGVSVVIETTDKLGKNIGK